MLDARPVLLPVLLLDLAQVILVPVHPHQPRDEQLVAVLAVLLELLLLALLLALALPRPLALCPRVCREGVEPARAGARRRVFELATGPGSRLATLAQRAKVFERVV